MAKKGKGKAKNDYDVMDPTKLSPNEKAAKKQIVNVIKSAAKAIAKIAKKIVEVLLHARTLWSTCFNYNNCHIIYNFINCFI